MTGYRKSEEPVLNYQTDYRPTWSSQNQPTSIKKVDRKHYWLKQRLVITTLNKLTELAWWSSGKMFAMKTKGEWFESHMSNV